MKGPMLIFFSLERSTLRKIYCLCILAMFTMSSKDVKHVNRPSLAV